MAAPPARGAPRSAWVSKRAKEGTAVAYTAAFSPRFWCFRSLSAFSLSPRFPGGGRNCAGDRRRRLECRVRALAAPSAFALLPVVRPRSECRVGMFQVGRSSIPKPVPRNLEDLDSVQRVLLHRSVRGRGWGETALRPRGLQRGEEQLFRVGCKEFLKICQEFLDNPAETVPFFLTTFHEATLEYLQGGDGP